MAALSQGNPTLAVEKFTAALKDNPEMVEAYINRGIAEMQLALWADAVGDFDKAMDLAPDSPEAYYNRGLAYSRQQGVRQGPGGLHPGRQIRPQGLADLLQPGQHLPGYG